MIKPDILERLQNNIQHLLAMLKNINEIAVHQSIDQFYYMQKTEELKIVKEQLDEARSHVANASERLDEIQKRLTRLHQEVYDTWRKDFLWLSEHLSDRNNR